MFAKRHSKAPKIHLRLYFNDLYEIKNKDEMRETLKNATLFVINGYENWNELAYSYLIVFIDWGDEMSISDYRYIFWKYSSVYNLYIAHYIS